MLTREVNFRIASGFLILASIGFWCVVFRIYPNPWEWLLLVAILAPCLAPTRYVWCGLALSGALMTYFAIFTLLTPFKTLHVGLIVAALVLDIAAVLCYREIKKASLRS